MIRLLIVMVIVAFGVVTFMPRGLVPGEQGPGAVIQNVREVMTDTSPRFRARLDAGADCSELTALRDTYDPASLEVQRMNDELRAIGCDSATSTRIR